MPPQRSGISDYSASLLIHLKDKFEITAIVDSHGEENFEPVPGVRILEASQYDAANFDLDVYHFGNSEKFHTYMHSPALDRPGILILHDPSLVDLYVGICGGTQTSLFAEEVRVNVGDEDVPIFTYPEGTRKELNMLGMLLSKRVVDTSLCVVVHSSWAKRRLLERSPGAIIEHHWHGTHELQAAEHPREGFVFGVFGGITPHKRVLEALEAFNHLIQTTPNARGTVRLLIAGRVDIPSYFQQVKQYISEEKLLDLVEVRTDVGGDAFDRALQDCDAAICLRWPTAGETSGVMMRALAAGKVVIASDVPQNHGLDESFCRLVSTDLAKERAELVHQMSSLQEDGAATLGLGNAARAFMKREASFEITAQHYEGLIRRFAGSRVPPEPRAPENRVSISNAVASRHILGVNAIGNWAATTGLAEAGRRAVDALIDSGFPVSIEDFDTGVSRDRKRMSAQLRAQPTGRVFGADLYFLNINEMPLVSDHFLVDPPRNRYKIGYWYWELPFIPPIFAGQLHRLDELWVASEYVKRAFEGEVDIPIHVMPCIVEPLEPKVVSRADLDLPEDRCIFLFHFDELSTFGRKNPLGIIEAFHRAFPSNTPHRPLLVMKTQNLDALPLAESILRKQIQSVGGILIDGELSADQMMNLMCSSDIYVSLHRAEGFGLGMAEAMYFSKPVIATAFSGNLEFCTTDTAALVGYKMTEVDLHELSLNPGAERVYVSGSMWAEPDLDQAAKWMTVLNGSEELRSRLGNAGASMIRERFGSDVAGATMKERLRSLA